MTAALVARVGWAERRDLWLAGSDQVVASLGNVLAVALVARVADGTTVGTFAAVMAFAAVALGLSRATASEVVAIEFPEGVGLRPAQPLGMALLVGVGAAAVAVAAAIVVHGPARGAMLVLAGCLPLLLVQDAARSVLLALGRPSHALVNDAAWTASTAVLVVVLVHGGNLGLAVACWAVPGALAGGVMLLQVGDRPSLAGARAWEAHHRPLVRTYIVEQVLVAAARPVALGVAGVVAGFAVSGALQASQVLFGPVIALHVCVPFLGYREAARARDRDLSTTAVGRALAGVAVVATVGWALVLWLTPDRLLDAVFGNGSDLASPVLLPTALLLVGVSLNLGALAVLRAHRSIAASRQLRILSSIGLVLGAAAGGALGDAPGAAWAMAIWTLVTSWWWVAAARRAGESS